MITDREAKNIAARIRRGTDTLKDRGEYDRWAKVAKGRRPRTTLGQLLTEQRQRKAASDLLQTRPRVGFDNPTPITGQTFDPAPMPADYVLHAARNLGAVSKEEPPIAPPLPLEGELVDDEPIAPPIDLPETPIPGFDLGGGAAKALRALLEKQDAKNPEIGGVSLAAMLGADFWTKWEAAAERLSTKYIGRVEIGDDELVVGGAGVVVAQPIAIPYVREHGASWLAALKRYVGFGETS